MEARSAVQTLKKRDLRKILMRVRLYGAPSHAHCCGGPTAGFRDWEIQGHMGFPKIGVPCQKVPKIRIIVFGAMLGVPLLWEMPTSIPTYPDLPKQEYTL